jgi:hypothetical protein
MFEMSAFPSLFEAQREYRCSSDPPMLVPIPIACFVGTLLIDVVYWRMADVIWADFSAWLVTVGTHVFAAALTSLNTISLPVLRRSRGVSVE